MAAGKPLDFGDGDQVAGLSVVRVPNWLMRRLAGSEDALVLMPPEAAAKMHAALRELFGSAVAAVLIQDAIDLRPAPPSPSPAQPSQDVAGTSGESLAGLSKEGSETP